MKISEWVAEVISEIKKASPVEDWECRECEFNVAVDGDGDVRLTGDTMVKFTVHLLSQANSLVSTI